MKINKLFLAQDLTLSLPSPPGCHYTSIISSRDNCINVIEYLCYRDTSALHLNISENKWSGRKLGSRLLGYIVMLKWLISICFPVKCVYVCMCIWMDVCTAMYIYELILITLPWHIRLFPCICKSKNCHTQIVQ